MNARNKLNYEINKILTEWNPIGVPEFIAEVEYISYINPIIIVGNDYCLLKKTIIRIVQEDMGLDFDELNELHISSINNVVEKILNLYKSEEIT
jgi:hypothetical protein